MLVRFGKWAVAVGIDWLNPGKSEVSGVTKKHGGQARVHIDRKPYQIWLGFHEPVKGDVYAAAPLVGLVVSNAVILFPITEDLVWVCMVRDGMPAALHDLILPTEEGRNKAREWHSMYGNDLEMVGDVPGASMGIDDILLRIEDQVAQKTIKKKQLAEFRLHNPRSAGRRVGFAVLGALIACSAFFAWQHHLNQQKAQRDQENIAMQAAQAAFLAMQGKMGAQANIQTQIANFQQQVESSRKEQANRVDPAQLWGRAAHLRRSLGVSIRGYLPQEFECDVQQCRVKWNGAGDDVLVGDKLSLPNVEPNYMPDRNAVSNFPFDPALVVSPMPARADAIVSAEQLHFWLYSAISQRFPGVTFDASQPVTLTPPQGSGLQPVVVGEVGKWHATFGAGALISAGELLGAISKWPVRVVSIKITNGSAVVIEGEYVFLGGK